MRFRDLRGLLEAGYRVHSDEERFAYAIAHAARLTISGGRGTAAVTYDLQANGQLRIRALQTTGFTRQQSSAFARGFEGMSPTFIKSRLRTEAISYSTLAKRRDPSIEDYLHFANVKNVISINGFDSTGRGIAAITHLAEPTSLSALEKSSLTRIAVHSIAALRLRDKSVDELAAIFDTSGAPVLICDHGLFEDRHVLGRVSSAVRNLTALRRAGPIRVPERLREFTPRVDARWTVVAQFRIFGEHHVVVKRNPCPTGQSEPRQLSERENQVSELMRTGRSMKLVAYELGIAYSTVRVLAARARRKRSGTSF
jgi:DNA-binding CsgD family transcriptional regulator